jgi:hypothetical protein
MLYIKKFIEKVTLAESRTNKDLVLSVTDARGLKDDIANLLADLYEKNKNTPQEKIVVELKGKSFKDE